MIINSLIKNIKLDAINSDSKELTRSWRNNPKIYKWCRQNDLLTEAGHENWFLKHQLDPKIQMYLIKDSDDTKLGVCGLTDIDLVNQRAEFSLYIDPTKQGRGFGRNALMLLCWHGFNSMPLKIIWGESFAGNPAIEMFKKVGFKIEGTRRDFYYRDGNHLDAILFSIKKEEFILC